MGKISQFFSQLNRKKIIGLIFLLIIIVTLPLVIIFSQQRQDTRQRAAGVPISPSFTVSGGVYVDNDNNGKVSTADTIYTGGVNMLLENLITQDAINVISPTGSYLFQNVSPVSTLQLGYVLVYKNLPSGYERVEPPFDPDQPSGSLPACTLNVGNKCAPCNWSKLVSTTPDVRLYGTCENGNLKDVRFLIRKTSTDPGIPNPILKPTDTPTPTKPPRNQAIAVTYNYKSEPVANEQFTIKVVAPSDIRTSTGNQKLLIDHTPQTVSYEKDEPLQNFDTYTWKGSLPTAKTYDIQFAANCNSTAKNCGNSPDLRIAPSTNITLVAPPTPTPTSASSIGLPPQVPTPTITPQPNSLPAPTNLRLSVCRDYNLAKGTANATLKWNDAPEGTGYTINIPEVSPLRYPQTLRGSAFFGILVEEITLGKTYTWTVKTTANGRNPSIPAQGTFTCAFPTPQATSTPTPTTPPAPGVPGNLQISCSGNNAILSWTASANATNGQQYEIIYNGHTFTSVLTSYTLPLDNNARVNSSVTVRPTNTNSNANKVINCPLPTATPRPTATPTPVPPTSTPTPLPAPTGLTYSCRYLSGGIQVNLDWNAVPGASSYKIQWNGRNYTASSSNYGISNVGAGTPWAWDVRAIGANGREGVATLSSFTCATPTATPKPTATPTPTPVPPTPTPTSCIKPKSQGNANGDCLIDNADYNIWASTFGTGDTRADFNNDGRVTIHDFGIWRDYRFGFR